MIVAVEQTLTVTLTHSILFVTDSQFVVNVVDQILDGTISKSPHKKAHWDLISRLSDAWQPARLHLLKIKPHLQLHEATSRADAWHIRGNAYADEAAGKSRTLDDQDFDSLCQHVRNHRQQQHNLLSSVYQYLVALACSRMEKLEQLPPGSDANPAGPAHRTSATAFNRAIGACRSWVAKPPLFPMPQEPHQVVFWCCPWGTNLARRVWEYCNLLKWLDPAQVTDPHDHGISWTELACSFMLWSGRHLPVRISYKESLITVPYDDLRVQCLPVKSRSLG